MAQRAEIIIIIIINPLTTRVVGAPDDFATSFLHSSLFFTALWDLPNSRHVHSLMLFSHLQLNKGAEEAGPFSPWSSTAGGSHRGPWFNSGSSWELSTVLCFLVWQQNRTQRLTSLTSVGFSLYFWNKAVGQAKCLCATHFTHHSWVRIKACYCLNHVFTFTHITNL